MKTLKTAFILFAIALCSLSCSNDDDNPMPEPEPTVEQLLTSGRWYFESRTNYPLNDCQKHSNFRFLENGNFVQEIFNDSSGSCDVETTISGTWELDSDTQISMIVSGTTSPFTIVSISEEEMIFNFILGGETITIVFDKNPGDG